MKDDMNRALYEIGAIAGNSEIRVVKSYAEMFHAEGKRFYESFGHALRFDGRKTYLRSNGSMPDTELTNHTSFLWYFFAHRRLMPFLNNYDVNVMCNVANARFRVPRIDDDEYCKEYATHVRKRIRRWGGGRDVPITAADIPTLAPNQRAMISSFIDVISIGGWRSGNFNHEVVYAIRHPVIVRRNRLGTIHAVNEPAIVFADGNEVYVVNNVVTRKHPVRRLTRSFILGARNVEERRVLIEELGFEEFADEANGTVISVDGFGELWEFDAPPWETANKMRLVKVVNSTPEPDGSYKDYFLRVPPDVETAEYAVAWTCGMEKVEFVVET